MKNKHIRLSIVLTLVALFSGGCNYLDYSERSSAGMDETFSTFAYAGGVLIAAYSSMQNGFSEVDDAMLDAATDDAVFVWSTNNIHNFYNGQWSALNTVAPQWGNFYTGIRRANLFLENANDEILEEFKFAPDYLQQKKRWDYYRFEARFLRAFFHFELAKRYGDVPLVLHTLTQSEANNTPRSSFKDVIEWIATECEEIAPNLPVSYTDATITPNIETGRATRGAALALRARALLYLASPLHNPVSAPDYQSRWIAAATAAHDLIASGIYSNTLPAWSNVFNNWRATNTELILERRQQGTTRTFETANFSIGFEGGNTGNCPTQNLVDCFEMSATGKGIFEEGSGYNSDAPYSGRDPRLAMTILCNGDTWKSRAMQCYEGGLDGLPRTGASPSGYYLKKGLVENTVISGANPVPTPHCWILFRYAEVLLNYAEAMNEAYGPAEKGNFTLSATEAVNFVRKRTGVAMLDFPATLSQDDFRTKIRNERRVELAFEGHRMWDIRRWKEGGLTRDIRGMKIVRDESNNTTYTPVTIQTRLWDDRMYFYPIPQTEIYATNGVLTQNPEW